MAEIAKLTKKQQKALKHRSGSARKDKGKEREQLEVPEEDLLEDAGEDSAAQETVATKSKKRKRENEDPDDLSKRPAKKSDKTATDGKSPRKEKQAKKQRFIVFVGNLPYKVTVQDIEAHFAEKCGEVPSVRLLTPKVPRGGTSEAAKSKGCAFVEFKTGSALQTALHQHGTLFESSLTRSKRKINVELTAGGGGKSEQRRQKLDQVKARLEKQRESHQLTQDQEKAKKEEERKKARDEERQRQEAEGLRPPKQNKKKLPKWLTGSNAMKLG